jgi:hypothetical protein
MTSESRQLALLPRPAAVATLGREYVPILLVKRGERQALAHLAPETWLGLTPWLRVLPPELRSRDDDRPPDAEMLRLNEIVGDRALYLDVAGTPRRSRRAPVLDREYVHRHFEAAVTAGLAIAPVLPLGRNDLAPVVARFAANLGAAVRLAPQDALTWSPREFESSIRRCVETLGIEESRLDVLIDLGYLDPNFDDQSSVLWLAEQVVAAARWRSVMLAATSVPDSLSAVIPEDSLNAIDRREATVIPSVEAAIGRHVRFSDYAVQHPVPPARGAAPKMRASIRYTSGPYMFVSRGGTPVGEINRGALSDHYRELASRLLQHRSFTGSECCWGDEFLERLADGRIEVRSQHSMRAVATCHHLTVLTREREPGRPPSDHPRRPRGRRPAAPRSLRR